MSAGTEAQRDQVATTVSLRDLLSVRSLALRLRAAPSRVDTQVRWAHPTELIDPRPYLSGQELVLTVGTALQEEPNCRAFVDHLVDAGVAGLGYGVGDVSEEIPTALLQACREHDLPLLEVPVGVPFQAITELLADRRAEARTARSRRVQRLATRLLDAMATDSPLAELVQMVQDDLGGHVTFADGVIAWSPATETDVRPARDTLEHLTAVLAVRQHEEDLETTNRRLELGRLLDLVLQGRADPEVLQHPLQLAGIEAEQPIAPAAWPRKAADLVASGLSPVLLADLGDVTISLSPVPGRAREVAEALSLPCGTGEPAPLAQLRQVVPAALAALKLARERGAPVGHQELTTFQALLEQQPPDWLIPFAEKLILPLLEHDKQHGTALLETLRAFLDNDGSINATARQLFLHANSLRHRLRRIHELTGAHPQAFDDRVALAIGLWAWDRRPRASR